MIVPLSTEYEIEAVSVHLEYTGAGKVLFNKAGLKIAEPARAEAALLD
jgi:hypothetical protein